MAAKISASVLNETMWVVYYAIGKDSNGTFVLNGNKVDPDFWIQTFSTRTKLKGALKVLGIESELSELGNEIRDIDSKMDAKYAADFFVNKDWHSALESQIKNFIRNPRVNFLRQLKIARQDTFYDESNIADFLSKVFKVFQITAKADRWNPSDVWFYNKAAITEIQNFLKTTSVYNNEVRMLSQRVKKNYALEDVIGLNRLILKLYEEHKLGPVSLKKSTSTKGVYSSRIGLVNVPQNDMGRPTPPKVTKRQLPIKEYPKEYVAGGLAGGKGIDLKYDIEIDQVILDMDGNKKYVREYDYLGYNSAGKTLGVKKERVFKEAQSGSIGLDVAEKIIYTANGSRSIKNVRDQVFRSNLSSDVLSRGQMRGKTREDQLENSLEYIKRMAEEIHPSIKDKQIRFARVESNNQSSLKDKESYVEVQNKMEIAYAIEKSGIPDEIVIDLWNAITSKGITNRRDYERLIEKIGKSKLQQSRKKGQKRLTQEQADEAAKTTLRATIVGDKTKIPGSFHIKLY